MNHMTLLAENWGDYLGDVLCGWWRDLPGPYRFAFVVLTLLVIAPWIGSWFSRKNKAEKNEADESAVASKGSAASRWCAGIGGLLFLGSTLSFLVARYNYTRVMELRRQVEAYRQENPISSTFFGVPGSERLETEAQSLSSFAYTFIPPLTPFEMLVFAGFFGGLALGNYAGQITEFRRQPATQSDAQRGG